MLNKVVLTFESMDEILNASIQMKAFQQVLSCGAVYYAAQSGSNFQFVDKILKCNQSYESY